MGKRIRTNMKNLVSHATPDGKARRSVGENLRIRFERGALNEDELRQLAVLVSLKHLIKPMKEEGDFVVISVFGKKIRLTKEEYAQHCASLNIQTL